MKTAILALVTFVTLVSSASFAMTDDEAEACKPSAAMLAAGEAAQPSINQMSDAQRDVLAAYSTEIASKARNCADANRLAARFLDKVGRAHGHYSRSLID